MILHGYYLSDPRVRREAEALFKAGYEVEVVCCRAQREAVKETVDGIRIMRLPIEKKRGGFCRYVFEYSSLTLLGTWKLAMLHASHRFDVIHVHNMPDILIVAGVIPKLLGAKLILDVHDPMVEHYCATYHIGSRGLFALALKTQERLSYWLADWVVTVSDTMSELLQDRGISSHRIFVLHNFPDDNKFPIKRVEDPWVGPANRFTLLYCGTVTEHYRLDIVIRALQRASLRLPLLRLTILGTGNKLEQIKQLAKDLHVEDRVRYLKPVPVEGVRDVMTGSDVVISAHQAGIFGDLYFSTKILESMTQGLPVISSRTKTISRYIPEEAVFYFEPGNVNDLVTQIVRIGTQPHLAREKRAHAFNLVKGYMWSSESKRLVDLYRKILEAPRK